VAGLAIEGGELVVRLSTMEKVWAFHRDLRVPLTAVQAVGVPQRPWTDMRGWRSAGVGIPGVAALGTRRHGYGKDFVAVHRQEPVVQVDLNGFPFERLLVSVGDAEATASAIADAAGIRR
jgi:hypothetical protein